MMPVVRGLGGFAPHELATKSGNQEAQVVRPFLLLPVGCIGTGMMT